MDDDEHEQPEQRTYCVCVFGSGAVGKSSLVMQFVHKRHVFSSDHDPTVEDVYNVSTMLEGSEVHVNVVDTAGQQELFEMRDQQIKNNEGFVLVYAINDRRGFDDLQSLVKHIIAIKGSKAFPCVLVENKGDLEKHRIVPKEEGQRLAAELQAPFFSASAKTGQSVKQIFDAILTRCNDLVKPELAGYLIKQGNGSRIFGRRSWLRRWFDIHANKVFYRTAPEAKDVLGQFNISEIKAVTINDDVPGQFEFSVDTSVRVYYMRAETKEDRDRWVQILRAMAKI